MFRLKFELEGMFLSPFLATIIALSVCGQTLATTYHVKRTGSDGNPGTSALPWRTIPKACSTAVAGDTVLIYPGFYPSTEYTQVSVMFPEEGGSGNPTYRQILVPLNEGTPANPIVFKGTGGSRPYIQGDNVNLPTPAYPSSHNVVTANLSWSSCVHLDSLHFANSNMAGIEVNGYGHRITNCKIDSIWEPDNVGLDNSGGIQNYVADVNSTSQGDRLVIRNNEISNVGIVQFGQGNENNSNGIGLYQGDTVEIVGNHIYHISAGAVKFKGLAGTGGRHVRVDSNLVHDCFFGLDLGNTGEDMDSVICRFNIIYDLLASSGAEEQDWVIAIGCNLFSGNSAVNHGVWIYNNTIDLNNPNALQGAQGLLPAQYNNGSEMWFFNNIIWDHQQDNSWKAVHFWQPPVFFYSNYNYYVTANPTTRQLFRYQGSNYTLNGWKAATSIANVAGQDSNSTATATVPFVNGLNHDYRLQAGSPALTAGRGGVFPSYVGAIGQASGSVDSTVSIMAASAVTEGTNLVFSLIAGASLGSSRTITYSTSNGTAVAPGDYTSVTNGQTTIPGGSTSGSIVIQTIDDSEVESTENMTVTLTGVSIGTVAVSSALGTINDNDIPARTLIAFPQLPGHSVGVSGTYGGYTIAPIADAVIDAYGNEATTWASDESNSTPHWVELVFGQQLAVSGITVHWAYNSGSSSFMEAQQFRVQRWNGTAYVDVTTVNNSSQDATSDVSFSAVSTDRVRIYQPAAQGPPNYTAIMWLTEVQIWGPQDTTPPAPVTDLR